MQSNQSKANISTIYFWIVLSIVFVLLLTGIVFFYVRYVKAQFSIKTPGSTLNMDDWNSLHSDLSYPIGSIIPFGGSLVPAGWILCDGSEVLRTLTYGNLFAVIGTSFGGGDGSNTFNLPDLRGRTPLGADNMGGVSADNVTSVDADTIGLGGGNPDGRNTHSGTTSAAPTPTQTIGGTAACIFSIGHSHTYTTDTADAMNPYQTVNYIIKY